MNDSDNPIGKAVYMSLIDPSVKSTYLTQPIRWDTKSTIHLTGYPRLNGYIQELIQRGGSGPFVVFCDVDELANGTWQSEAGLIIVKNTFQDKPADKMMVTTLAAWEAFQKHEMVGE